MPRAKTMIGGWPRRLWRFIKRCIKRYSEGQVGDWAAALTYYGMLSLFPALLVLVSIVGLIGSSLTNPLIDNLSDLAPSDAQSIFVDALSNLEKDRPTAGVLLFISMVTALWSASSYIKAFARATNVVYKVRDDRNFWKLGISNLLITLALMLILLLVALAITFSGDLAKELARVLGVNESSVSVWSVVRWPVILLALLGIVEFLYNVSPVVSNQRFRWINPGVIVAVVLWIAISFAFTTYVSNFGKYNETYGSIAGVVVFLIWLWLSNVSLLLGVVVNAELKAGREKSAEPAV